MNPTPKVSIIICTYNRKDLIPFALKSALSQVFSDFEILILDDASTDDTREAISTFLEDDRVRYILHPQNIGITANRNYGLSIAKGEYVAVLDSDDMWLDDAKIRRQVEFLDSHEDHGLIGTFAKIIDEKGENAGEIRSNTADSSMRRNFLIRNQIIHSSVLIRKKAIDDVGPYDEKIPIWEDYELWLRIGEKYKFRNIPEFLTGYRIHNKNISNEDEEKGIKSSLLIITLHQKTYSNYWIGYLKQILKKIQLSLHLKKNVRDS